MLFYVTYQLVINAGHVEDDRCLSAENVFHMTVGEIFNAEPDG